MKTQAPIFTTIKKVVIFLLLLHSSFIQAQENTWESKPKGSNPWVKQTTSISSDKSNNLKSELPKYPDPVKEDTTSAFVLDATSKENDEIVDRFYASKNSTSSVRYFYVQDTIVKLNANDPQYYKKLKRIGSKMHKANAALGLGVATASFFNLFALPVNMVAAAIPVPVVKHKVERFIADNPHASKREIKAIKNGISARRFNNTLKGVAIGVGVNVLAIAAIA